MKQQINRIDFEITGSELLALLKESDEIKRKQPLFNRSQRRTYYSYGITQSLTSEGYIALRVEKLNDADHPLISFSSKMAAREYLFRLIEKHELCQQISGLYPPGGPCFHFTIKQCNGACISQESPEEFNYRAEDAINELTYLHRDFVILDKGRRSDEKSIVVIENGMYQGFGYLSEDNQIEKPHEFKDFITNYEDNRDVQQIIRSYLKNKRVEKILEFD